MNWLEIKSWKQSFVSTLICLIGCSVGTMGTTVYLIHYNWFVIFLISFLAGFISCFVFMVLWHTITRQLKFIDAIKMSFKMSSVSILIMMCIENVVFVTITPQFSNHQLHETIHSLMTMIMAMSLGFLFALPYNYYQLQNNNKVCH